MSTAVGPQGDMAPQPMVEARDLSLGDLRMQAYQHVDLRLERGKAHALCAEDKGGKAELLLTIAGRMKPSSGSCKVAGYDVRTWRGMSRVRKISALSFIENVNEVERVLRVRTIASAELGLSGKRSDSASTRSFLAQWGLLDVADTVIEDLPQPVYDRLGIALAMAHDPQILCVGDIEGNLTEKESLELCELLCRLAHDGGLTVVCGVIDYALATHFDTVSCITDGACVQRSEYVPRHANKEVA